MIHILGDDIFSKYVIVKGKKQFKLLYKYGVFGSSAYDWLNQGKILEKGYSVCLFNTEAEAREFIANLPDQKRFKDAVIKNITIKLI